ncbi:WD40 repeat domain-containing protein [Pseudoalteromonas sp. MMG022]|uniref:WD40 repeat domain-containing protein n=1 Tax=Pseudoalteromonas sp. MMG022 TaxID=2909978 RepID=UPI001F1A662E|nr:WD40 repeat domain-containing protein [Pseudoalteromonas sp. MMG022]MCF6436619.1 WD40 repeat domain-containing protein [Pseudoalteromonas sp. MMG022]
MVRWLLINVMIFLLLGCSDPTSTHPSSRHQYSDALVLSGQLSHDGKQLLLVVEGPNLALWDTTSKRVLMSLSETQLPDKIRALVLHKPSQQLLVADDELVQFWNIPEGTLQGTLRVSGVDELARISQLAMSDNGALVAIGFTDGSVSIADRNTEKMNQFMPHSSNVIAIHIIEDRLMMVTGSHDGVVNAWNMQTGQSYYQQEYASRLSSVSVSNERDKIFVSDSLRTQQVLAIDDGQVLNELAYITRFKWFRQALFIPKTPWLITSTPKSELSIWDTSSGKEKQSWQIDTHSSGTTLLDMVIVDDTLLTLSSEGVVESWRLSEMIADL